MEGGEGLFFLKKNNIGNPIKKIQKINKKKVLDIANSPMSLFNSGFKVWSPELFTFDSDEKIFFSSDSVHKKYSLYDNRYRCQTSKNFNGSSYLERKKHVLGKNIHRGLTKNFAFIAHYG